MISTIHPQKTSLAWSRTELTGTLSSPSEIRRLTEFPYNTTMTPERCSFEPGLLICGKTALVFRPACCVKQRKPKQAWENQKSRPAVAQLKAHLQLDAKYTFPNHPALPNGSAMDLEQK